MRRDGTELGRSCSVRLGLATLLAAEPRALSLVSLPLVESNALMVLSVAVFWGASVSMWSWP